jgi:hypothetical protein
MEINKPTTPAAPQSPRPPRNNNRAQKGPKKGRSGDNKSAIGGISRASRGAAMRAQRRNQDDAQRIANQYLPGSAGEQPKRANFIDDTPRVKTIPLGGQDGGGSKNMILMEYMNDAIIMDCGNDLVLIFPVLTTVLLILRTSNPFDTSSKVT